MTDRTRLVVAGGGRVGRRVAEDFANRGHEVTVIEQDPSVVDTDETGSRVTYV